MLSRPFTRAIAVTAISTMGAVAAPPGAGAQRDAARNATLWVTLGDSDQLVEVDAYSFTEVRRITTDPRPHGLAASRDGSKIYVGSDRTGNLQVIDARSRERYEGTAPEPWPGRRSGRIPGSLNVPFTDLIDPATGEMRRASELQKIFAAAHADLARPCGSSRR